jgi:NADH-quinone oxidoreductase subunit J
MPGLLILFLVLGAIGLFLAMPGGRSRTARAGLIVLAAAGATLIAATTRLLAPQPGIGVFVGGALVALFAAVRVITHKRPVYSALYFVLLIVAVAALLVQMQAEFLAVALVIIYAGAILVTYIFVIMLAQQARPAAYDTKAREPLLGCLAGFVLLWVLAGQLFGGSAATEAPAAGATAAGTVAAVGTELLTTYIVGIQIVGLLLLAALVGAIAIARRRPAEGRGVEDDA